MRKERLGCGLLGGAAARTLALRGEPQLLDAAFDDEGLVVRLALGLLDGIAWQREAARLQVLLQRRLRVLPNGKPFGPLEAIGEERLDRATNRIETAVEVDRPQQRLERVGEDRGTAKAAALELAFAQAQPVAETEARRKLGKRRLVRQGRARARSEERRVGKECRL